MCEHCGAPMDVREMALRQKYHPKCKREVDRERALMRMADKRGSKHANVCVQCGKGFVSKRKGAKTCGARCRVALHRGSLAVR